MKYIMKMKMSQDKGDKAIRDPQFGHKMHDLLAEIKAESAYFTTICGHRGAYIVVNINDASEIPGIAEPFFLWLGADVDFIQVMTPEDLAKGGPAMAAAVQKWG